MRCCSDAVMQRRNKRCCYGSQCVETALTIAREESSAIMMLSEPRPNPSAESETSRRCSTQADPIKPAQISGDGRGNASSDHGMIPAPT